MTLTVGSLFSGIGGLELGLERAGMRVVWQVEKDEYCREVLAKHWPSVTRYEDVKDVGKETLEAVDLICGGFPCQDISTAGKREGIRASRSGLWFEYARIVRELRPKYVLVENVSALLVRGLDVVLSELAESGYDAEWFVLAAAHMGAPHIRERVFVLAYPASDIRRASGNARSAASNRSGAFLADDSSGRRREGRTRRFDCGGARAAKQPLRNATDEGLSDGPTITMGKPESVAQPQPSDWWAVEPDVGRVAHGVPSRVDRLKSLGNAVVPQVSEWIGRRIVEADEALRGAA